MKKIFVVILIISMLFYAKQNENFSLLNYFDGEYSIFTENKICEESLNLGFCYMTNKKVSASCVKGESIKIVNGEAGEAINVLKAKVVSTEELETGATVIYGLSPLIVDKVEMDGKLVNLQIAIYDEYIIIGWPLILGSF